MSEPNELSPKRTRTLVALMVTITGLVLFTPNFLPLWFYWTANREEAVTARWVGSSVAKSSADTVEVPTYLFTRKIGPMAQDCRVPLVRYRHQPGGKPVWQSFQVVVGETCTDLIVLDDPPRERIPLALLGLAVAGIGLYLLVRVRKAA